MLRRLSILSAFVLIAHGGFTASQERFELSVPGSATRSTAELTASALTVNHQGKVSVYSRDNRFDVPGYLGFTNTTLRQIIGWPSKGTGAMQIAVMPLAGKPQFRQSQMQVSRVAAPIGTVLAPLRGGPVDTTRTYRLTNAFLGQSRSLASDARGTTAMDRSGDFTNQSWRFVAVGPQTYRLSNAALGDGFSLTAHARDPRPTMERTDPRSKAQTWRVTLQGTEVRLTNEAVGWSLDNDGGGSNEPLLAANGNFAGQLWTLTELGTAKDVGIVGTWNEYVVATNQPVGITVEIRRDLTFLQTQPGQPDRVGTVQLVGNRLTLGQVGAIAEQYLVKLTADRIDFQELNGTPTGFFWRRRSTGILPPKFGLARRISQTVVPNPALAPATVELVNSHSEELWVLVSDLRDVARVKRLKIPSGKSATIQLERDAGSRIVEIWDIPATGIRQERESEIPPKQLYNISVYELFVQSISIDATARGGGRVDEVNRSPKSVGMIDVPPGDRFQGGKTDIYAAAKRQKNSGGVRRIDPANWRESSASDDPLQRLLQPRR